MAICRLSNTDILTHHIHPDHDLHGGRHRNTIIAEIAESNISSKYVVMAYHADGTVVVPRSKETNEQLLDLTKKVFVFFGCY